MRASLRAVTDDVDAARAIGAKLLDAIQAAGDPGKRGEAQFTPQCLDAHVNAAASLRKLAEVLSQPQFKILAELRSSLEAYVLAAEARAQEPDAKLKEAIAAGTKTPDVLAALDAALKGKANELLTVDHSMLEGLSKANAFVAPTAARFLPCKTLSQSGQAPNILGGIVISAVLIAMLVWLAHAIGGQDFLAQLARVETARGLLTLLVGPGTMVVGLALVLGMWLGDGDAESEKKFLRSKELFTLLLSVFGTVLGFYYESDKGSARESALEVAPIVTFRESSTNAHASTLVSGGKTPYYFTIAGFTTNHPADGRQIDYEFTNLATNGIVPFKLLVTDGNSNHVSESGVIPALEKWHRVPVPGALRV